MRTVDLTGKSSLYEILMEAEDSDFPLSEGEHAYQNMYNMMVVNMAPYSQTVEMGAMSSELSQWIIKLKEAQKIPDEAARKKTIDDLLDEDPCIFLNKHGKQHTDKVAEKALEIMKCFRLLNVSYYEVFFLMCAIIIHDVGNILGRAKHEKKAADLLDKECSGVIKDALERRVIARIAGAHGGTIKGDKDTISILLPKQTVKGCKIRERLLAAVLRFADELADDATRANYPAIENELLRANSEIYHVYSSVLHGVNVEYNNVSDNWFVSLSYNIGRETAGKIFHKGDKETYLLDEIYRRTFKMEQERRYCNRFFHPYCSIDQIKVEICLRRKTYDSRSITYTLEEKGYPVKPYESIKDVDPLLSTGIEMAKILEEEDEKDDAAE